MPYYDAVFESPDDLPPPPPLDNKKKRQAGGGSQPVAQPPPEPMGTAYPSMPSTTQPEPQAMKRGGQSVMPQKQQSVFEGIPDYAAVFDYMAPMQRPDWRTLLTRPPPATQDGGGLPSFGRGLANKVSKAATGKTPF